MEQRTPFSGLALPATTCALILLTGCRGTLRMYPGAGRPAEQLAVLSVPAEVRFGAIDRRNLKSDNPGHIELLPGPHSIRIQYFGKKLRTQYTDLSFSLQAGHAYELRYRMYRAGGDRIFSPDYLKLLISSPGEERRTVMPQTVFGANCWCPFVFDITDRRRVTLQDPRKDAEVTTILTVLQRQDQLAAGMKAVQAQHAKERRK